MCVCCNKTILCLYIYSDKLVNQQVISYCPYFHCTVVHLEECMSAKMVHFLRCHDIDTEPLYHSFIYSLLSLLSNNRAHGHYTLVGSPAWGPVLNPLVAYTSTTVYILCPRPNNNQILTIYQGVHFTHFNESKWVHNRVQIYKVLGSICGPGQWSGNHWPGQLTGKIFFFNARNLFAIKRIEKNCYLG